MPSPLISIITVVYNDDKNLEKTILSIINQTYKNLEYVIIDGGSSDGTVEILKKYENRLSKFISEPDYGIYDAMNKGITNIKGEWVNFMNSGDQFFSNDTVEKIAENFSSDLNIVYGDTALLRGGKLLGIIKKAKDIDSIKRGMPFCHQSVFVKADLLKARPFDLNYKMCADYDFFLGTYKNKKIASKKLDLTICYFDVLGTSNGKTTQRENLKIALKYFPFSILIINHFYMLFLDSSYWFIKWLVPIRVFEIFKLMKLKLKSYNQN